MKRILFFISRCDEKSGLLRQIVNLANGLHNAGNHVEILTLSGTRDDLYFALNDDIALNSVFGNTKKLASNETNSKYSANSCTQATTDSLENTTEKKKRPITRRLLISAKRSISHISFVQHRSFKKHYGQYFEVSKPDVVVVWGTRRLSRTWYATRGLNCKIFDAEFNSYEKTFAHNDKRNNKLLKRIDGLIVQTASEKELFSSYSNRIFVINNPIADNLPMPYIGKRKKQIVNFCRISPQKNLKLLIDAFEMFHREYPSFVLHIYGDVSVDKKTDIAYRDSLIDIIKQKSLEDSVFIFPGKKDIHQIILDSSMFVSSSDYEGLSNSMLEAMAIGIPCVCTDCMGGGTREVMIDRKNGLIVPMNNPDAMYRAMKEFVDNPRLAQICSENATEIREQLSLNRIIKQWIEVIA